MTSIQPVPLPAALQVVSGVSDPIAAALATAQSDVVLFMSEHDEKDKWKIGQFALNHMGWPPNAAAEGAELLLLHAISGTRTPGGVDAAKFWASHGMVDVWEPYLKQYQLTHSPRQAAAAARLLHDTLDQVNTYTQIGKAAAGRKRPYVTDPTLEVAVDKPGNNPSYPSGHTSSAYAGAIVMSYLMPQLKDQFMTMALQIAYSRVYAGVHFPSDVAAGAKIAAEISTYLCATSHIDTMEAGVPVPQKPHGKGRGQARHRGHLAHSPRSAHAG
ncbi:MAG: phosphatase PAP2 family protein [Thermoleophilia bacterium]|nr:phosphatase PAP2 family protein [Thermoleophilia bacterium]